MNFWSMIAEKLLQVLRVVIRYCDQRGRRRGLFFCAASNVRTVLVMSDT
jgi:hypothetical protein